MRVAVGSFIVAVNTFATQPLSLETVQRGTLGADALSRMGRGDSALSGFLAGARECNWEVTPLKFVFSGGSGKITREAYEWSKEGFLKALGEAGPVDGLFLQLHGTAVAQHVDDCEGDLLTSLRDLLGEKRAIIASLDGHANVTPVMTKAADVLIGVKTNPHYDFVPIGRKAAKLMAGIFDGDLAPRSHWAQPPMAPALQKLYIAPGWPMEHLVRVTQNREAGNSKVLDISLLGGFFVSEIPETGISIVVTTDREPNLAHEIAEEMKEMCWARRQAFHTDMVSLQDGVREAIESEDGPVVLGDLADSGGAGTPGDGTAVLAELLKQNAKDAVVGNIADSASVQAAIHAGVGKQVTLTVGGKVDQFHGRPLQISGRVRTIQDGIFNSSTLFNSGRFHRGPTVLVECGGVEVILTSRPVLVFEPNHFRSLGIEPTERKILVCKAELQHRAGFAGIARKFIDVDTPGLATQVLSRLPYGKIRRPVFPLDNI